MNKATVTKYLMLFVDYGPIILTILLGVFVAVLNSHQPLSVQQLMSWILILLLLLATSQLIDRFRVLRAIEDKTERIRSILGKRHSLLRNKNDRKDLQDIGGHAKTIDVLAWSARGLFADNENFWNQKVDEGCKIRVIIVDVESEAANVIYENSENKEIKNDIRHTINRIGRLKKNHRNQKVELRKTTWVSPYSMIIVDKKKSKGILQLAINPAHLPTPSEPQYLVIDSQNDSPKFGFFINQFEGLWDDSTPVD